MAKDRNTFAKHQREVEKKRKRDEKRKRREQRKNSPADAKGSPLMLTLAERKVLDVFRQYLMTPGQMLCFSKADLETFAAPLDQMIGKGIVVADEYQGGFSLTKTGYAAMTGGD